MFAFTLQDPLENDLDWTTRSEKVPWYKRRNFWRYGVPCMISVGLIVAVGATKAGTRGLVALGMSACVA